MNWNETFKEYAVDMAIRYKEDKDNTLKSLGFDSVMGCLNETYEILVSEKEIKPLEMLEEKIKQELWEKSKEYSEDRRKRMLICRSIYLLEKLTA